MTQTLDELIKRRIAEARCMCFMPCRPQGFLGMLMACTCFAASRGKIPSHAFTYMLLSPCPARFDDVVRVVAPPPETKRTTLELDDSKPQQARGECIF